MCTKDRYPGAETYVACADVTRRCGIRFIEGILSTDAETLVGGETAEHRNPKCEPWLLENVGACQLSQASAVPTFPCREDERCLPEAGLRFSVAGLQLFRVIFFGARPGYIGLPSDIFVFDLQRG